MCKNTADNLYNNKDLENAFIEYYFLKNITIKELAKGKYSQNDLQKVLWYCVVLGLHFPLFTFEKSEVQELL